MKFHVGQMVRVNCPVSDAHGQVTTITRLNVTGYHYRKEFVGHMVDIKNWPGEEAQYCIFEPHELIPIDDFRAGSWDEICALTRGWRPGVEVHS